MYYFELELLITATWRCPKKKVLLFDGTEFCASTGDNQNRGSVAVRNLETSTFQNSKHIRTHRHSHSFHTCTRVCRNTHKGSFFLDHFPTERPAPGPGGSMPSTGCGLTQPAQRGPARSLVGDLGARENKAFCKFFIWRQQSELPWPAHKKLIIHYSANAFC